MAPGDAATPRRRRRLSRSGEFDRVYREGDSIANRHLVLYSFARGDESEREVRLGVSAGRKVGGAVERTRVKRALREAFWALTELLPQGCDFVVVARSPIADLVAREGTPGVERALRDLLERPQP